MRLTFHERLLPFTWVNICINTMNACTCLIGNVAYPLYLKCVLNVPLFLTGATYHDLTRCPYALHAITKQKQIYDEMQHSNRIWHSMIQYDRSKYKCDAVNCGTQYNKIWLLVYSIHKQNQQSNFFWLNVSLPQWKKQNVQLFCFCIYVYVYVYVCVCVCGWVG